MQQDVLAYMRNLVEALIEKVLTYSPDSSPVLANVYFELVPQ